jgi:hypothetical protein
MSGHTHGACVPSAVTITRLDTHGACVPSAVATSAVMAKDTNKIIHHGTEFQKDRQTDRITIPGCKYILTSLVQRKKNDSPIELSD